MVGILQQILRLFLSLTFLLQASYTQLDSNYIGCFEDRQHEWSFFWWPQGRTTQTATSCNQICAGERFSYFGMGGVVGTDCHCGNGGYDLYPPSGECTICTRFSQTFGCGAKSGNNRITSVYRTSGGPQRSTDDRFIGCWSADNPRTVLDTRSTIAVEDDRALTLESCLRQCWKRGYVYAGLMLATNCYCGNDLQWEGENRRPVATSSCDMSCDGNNVHVCGGQSNDVIAIYRAAPTEPFWGTYVGCFSDFADEWVFFWWPEAKYSRFHPVSSCLVLCKEQGFTYFGLGNRYGTECYCGNGNYAKFGPSNACKRCTLQGETFSCAARWGDFRLLSVYQIKDQVPVDQRYVGCWTADDPIYVLGNKPVKALEKASVMSVALCVNDCVKAGKAYSGLMRGTQCYCGNFLRWLGTNKRPAAAALCDAPCSGDAANACGGSNAVISIYRAECPEGTYGAKGKGCASCNCHEGALCNRTTGVCPKACAPGWKSKDGKGPCSFACSELKYGIDCKLTCHCYANVTCNRVLGKCPGPCAPGWSVPVGDLACSKRGTAAAPKKQVEKKKSNILPIALGAGLGGFFLMVVIITCCCCRKRKQEKKRQRLAEEAAARKLEEARLKREQRRRRDS